MTTFDKENAEKCDRIRGNMLHICEFLHMRHNLRICDFTSICGMLQRLSLLVAQYFLTIHHIGKSERYDVSYFFHRRFTWMVGGPIFFTKQRLC